MTDNFDQPFYAGAQQPFDANDFVANPEPRLPTLLLCDTSLSMAKGDAIGQLNGGIAAFRAAMLRDKLARKRVEPAMITYGPVNVASHFATAEGFDPPILTAANDTPMGAAILRGLAFLADRKTALRTAGVALFRPLVLLISDGAPTDEWAAAAEAVRRGEKEKKFIFHTIGVRDANMEILGKISLRPPSHIAETEFAAFFEFLANSVSQMSRSSPDGADDALEPGDPS